MVRVRLLRILALALLPGLGCAADVEGTLHWLQEMELSTPVSGLVESVFVVPGQRVRKGDLLVSLDTRPFDARVARADARRAGLVPARDEAKRELERAEELYERTVLSDHELQQARIDYQTAQAAWLEAMAELRLARLDREYAELRAPFDALVLERMIEPGRAVVNRTLATPLLRLAAAGEMAVRVRLPAQQLAQYQGGEVAKITVRGHTLEGRVASTGLVAEPDGHALLELHFQVPEGLQLRAGERARVTLPQSTGVGGRAE